MLAPFESRAAPFQKGGSQRPAKPSTNIGPAGLPAGEAPPPAGRQDRKASDHGYAIARLEPG